MSIEPRFRFAPTPSRELHVGNALAALFGWSMARAARGRFILRIEDIDRARCKPEYEEAIFRDLAWLGLDWDEGPDVGGPCESYRQSERIESYDELLRRLEESRLTYACVCSRADIRSAQSAPLADEANELPYPGTCRAEEHELPNDRGGYRLDLESLRARIGLEPVVSWLDGLRGPQSEDVRTTSGDVLLGRPGQPTYQLAVVADARAMGVTDVVRGVDLIGSTARQILLHQALAHLAANPSKSGGRSARNARAALVTPTPRFHHHPLLLDGDGHKLSKRDAAQSLSTVAATSDPSVFRAQLGRAIGLFADTVRRASREDWIDALGSTKPPLSERAASLHDSPWPVPTAT